MRKITGHQHKRVQLKNFLTFYLKSATENLESILQSNYEFLFQGEVQILTGGKGTSCLKSTSLIRTTFKADSVQIRNQRL